MSGIRIISFRAAAGFAIFAFGLLILSTCPSSAQTNFDRPGADYLRTPVPSGDPALCALQCERDKKCHAWSFNYPTISDENAVCWLKSSVTPRIASTCCISGVRGAGVVEPRTNAIEVEIDRQGGDYRAIDVETGANGDPCKAACEADNKCRAWSYARPGYVVKSARCFLKDQVKPPRRKPGFISGVVR